MSILNQSAPLLSVSNLHVHCLSGDAKKHHAVKGIHFSISEGEMVALVGESGSGKSITAQAMMYLLNPAVYQTSGEIWLENIPLHALSEKQLQGIRGKNIGMVFQDPLAALNPTMRVGSQITESILYHQKVTKGAARQQAIEMLNNVGISDPVSRFDAYPFQLSGGMRQRVAIAIALACSPKLLIADEPTTALDVTIQAQILELLKRRCAASGMSLLLITHDLSIVSSISDRILVMKGGEIIEEGSKEDIFYRPKHPYVKTLIAAIPALC